MIPAILYKLYDQFVSIFKSKQSTNINEHINTGIKKTVSIISYSTSKPMVHL